jgi:predicted NBD/HSP70 family sugar kinase
MVKPYVASHLKDMNRKTVFDLISEAGAIPRTQISRLTGISAPTVLKITNFLCEKGLILNAGEAESALGRKPQLLVLNPDFAYSVGVDYEGDYLKIGIVNAKGEIRLKKTIHVLNDFEYVVMDALIGYVQDLINESGIPQDRIIGLGMGFPGVVNYDSSDIRYGPLVGVYSKYSIHDIVEKIQQGLGMPVYIYNDANAAAIGEYTKRKLKNEDFIYISLGTGLGSGIILDGHLRFGKHYIAGEIGYMVYETGFQTSEFRPGLLESLINIHALKSKFKDFEDRIKSSSNTEEIIL